MKDAILIELAAVWELQAETGGDGLNKLQPAARETLRACADALRMLVDSQPAPPSPPVAQDAQQGQGDDDTLAVVANLGAALRRLVICARTAGGTAGPDAELMAACEQAENALSLRGMADAIAARSLPTSGGEPVAWQSRFVGESKWSECSKGFHDWVKRCQAEFPEHEARALYATPPTSAGEQARQAMSDAQMWSLWNSQGVDEMNQQEAIAFARAIEQSATESLRAEVEAANRNAAAALDLVSRIRWALGDNGVRMQDELIEWCKELAAQRAELARLRGEVEALRKDAERLDALARPGWELSQNNDPECAPHEQWQVHRVSGGRNDREWTLIGEGSMPRATIDAALANTQESKTRGRSEG